jgi:hypothetical protein
MPVNKPRIYRPEMSPVALKIISAACRQSHIPLSFLYDGNRQQNTMVAMRLAALGLRLFLRDGVSNGRPLSWPRIAELLGRNHVTIMHHACTAMKSPDMVFARIAYIATLEAELGRKARWSSVNEEHFEYFWKKRNENRVRMAKYQRNHTLRRVIENVKEIVS